jgi:hypothetical protein
MDPDGELQAVAPFGERKVRTPTSSMLANGEARRRDGKCNRKDTAAAIILRDGGCGKGEMVR